MSWTSLFSGGGGSSLNTWGNALGGAANSGGSGFDWGSTVSDIFGGGGGGVDYGSLLGTVSGASSSAGGGSNWMSSLGNLLGGSGGGGQTAGGTSSVYGDLFKGILSGVGASAAAKGDLAMAKEVTQIKGQEDRKTTAFEAELLDYYKQRDNSRKFKALDQYGQFSRVSKFAPTYKPTYMGPVDPGATAPQPKA